MSPQVNALRGDETTAIHTAKAKASTKTLKEGLEDKDAELWLTPTQETVRQVVGDRATWLPSSSADSLGSHQLWDWAESRIGEMLTFYHLPRAHREHPKSTNRRERFSSCKPTGYPEPASGADKSTCSP